MTVAIIADHRKIRITSRGNAQLLQRVRPTSAARAVHCGNSLSFVSQYQPASGDSGLRRGTSLPRRLAQKLAVRGVTEIKVAVPAPAGDEKRPRGHGLGLQRFYRCMRRAFCSDD